MKAEFRKNKIIIYISSFAIASLGMYVILFARGIGKNGSHCISAGDNLHTYIIVIYSYLCDLFHGEYLHYSWNIGMDINTSLIDAYYTINPFNLL